MSNIMKRSKTPKSKSSVKTAPIVTETEKQRILVDELTVYKSELTPYGKRLIEHYAKVFNNENDDEFVFEHEAEEEEEEEEADDYDWEDD